MKLMIFIGIGLFSILGGWIGAAMSGGNWFSGWGILLSVVGSFVGIWAGFKTGRALGF